MTEIYVEIYLSKRPYKFDISDVPYEIDTTVFNFQFLISCLKDNLKVWQTCIKQ